MSNFLWPKLHHLRLLCPSLSEVCSSSCPLNQWCPPTNLILCFPFPLLPSIFSRIRVFSVSKFFTSDGQSTGASTLASVLPMNIQGWVSVGLTGLNSLLSKGLSRVFSSTTVWKRQFLNVWPSLWYNSHTIHGYWKNYSFDCMDLCWQSDISAFYYSV